MRVWRNWTDGAASPVRRSRPVRLDGLRGDLVHAFRSNRRKPGLAVLAVLALALGIGVNIASLTVAYEVLGRPLPYPESSRIVVLDLLFADGGSLGFAPRALTEWLQRLRTTEAAAAYSRREVTIQSRTHTMAEPAALVTDAFFDVLGVPAESGRAAARAGAGEIVVSRQAADRLWTNGRDAPTGEPASVSERSYTVSGVMPRNFAFPDNEVAVWLPSNAEALGYSRIVARLKPGVTLQQVRDDLDRIRLELNPKSTEVPSVTSIGEARISGFRGLLTAALVGGALVFLVACANVATLFLGRDITRRRELATRMAMGANRLQLARAVLVDTLVIAAVACIAGAGVGAAVLKLFRAEAVGAVPALNVDVRLPVVMIAIAMLTLVATLLCGGIPAWHAARLGAGAMREAADAPRIWRMRNALVVAQIALCSILLVSANLLVRTVAALTNDDHGFEPARALEARIVLSDSAFPVDNRARDAFIPALLDRVRGVPGVQYAGFGTSLPPRPPLVSVRIAVRSADGEQERMMSIAWATPGYLRALGARFLAGRDFTSVDGSDSSPGVVLSESAARALFAGENPIGRPIPNLPSMFRAAAHSRVVGVVRDIKYDGLDSPPGSTIYLPSGRRSLGRGYLVARTQQEPVGLVAEIRRIAAEIDPTIPIAEVQSLEDALSQSIADRRFRALPAVLFGSLALAVALVGLVASLSMLIAERRRDLAIRLAVGARPSTLVRAVIRQGMVLTAVGVACGLGIAIAAARGLSAFLYQVSPYDAVSFVGAACVIAASAILVSCGAALRTRGINARLIVLNE